MNRKSMLTILSATLVACALLLSASGTTAEGPTAPASAPALAPLGTAFTYQGYLTDGGSPANGTYDFEFKLYDDPAAGTPVGSTVTKDDVTVTEGVFTVELDFGAVFDGTALYLQIGVRPGASTGAYTPLTPRRALTATPYALYANNGPFWSLTGNSGTDPTSSFLGTTDNVSLTLRVNNTAALRIVPTAGSPNIIGGSSGNSVTSGVYGATISGGGGIVGINRVTDEYGTVGGGRSNQAGDNAGTTSDRAFATVGGGENNTASGYYATVPGGNNNSATMSYTLAAGRRAKANHEGAFVWGDSTNADVTSTANDQFTVRATGGISLAFGSGMWRALPDATSPNIVAGYNGNTVTSGVYGATIGGGGNSTYANSVTDNYGTIGGGRYNQAGNNSGTTSDAPYATVAGGFGNIASATDASVGGGFFNTASGLAATVPGGVSNSATMSYTLAAGRRAKANHEGAFVWADSTNSDFASSGNNQFLVRAGGGVGIVDSGTIFTPTAQLHISSSGGDSMPQLRVDKSSAGDYSRIRMTVQGSYGNRWDLAANATAFVLYTGAYGQEALKIAPGDATNYMLMGNGARLTIGGVWTNASDRNAKMNFTSVDGRAVLDKLMDVPITTWSYKAENPTIRHIGPMAQDFYTAFNVGVDDKSIGTVDADGVALAAIQGLYQIVQEKDVEISSLKSQVSQQQAEIEDIKARLSALEQQSAIANPQSLCLATGQAAIHNPQSAIPSPWLLFGGLILGGLALGWRRRKGVS